MTPHHPAMSPPRSSLTVTPRSHPAFPEPVEQPPDEARSVGRVRGSGRDRAGGDIGLVLVPPRPRDRSPARVVAEPAGAAAAALGDAGRLADGDARDQEGRGHLQAAGRGAAHDGGPAAAAPSAAPAAPARRGRSRRPHRPVQEEEERPTPARTVARTTAVRTTAVRTAAARTAATRTVGGQNGGARTAARTAAARTAAATRPPTTTRTRPRAAGTLPLTTARTTTSRPRTTESHRDPLRAAGTRPRTGAGGAHPRPAATGRRAVYGQPQPGSDPGAGLWC